MIDLHTHTNHSDGTDSVEELLKNAEKSNIEILSITDHDSVGAYFELEKNPSLRNIYSGKLIVGAELKTFYNKVSIEVLGYGIDYKKLRIHKYDANKMQCEIMEKYIKIADEIGLKYDKNELYIDRNNPSKQWASFTLANEILRYEENAELIHKLGDFDSASFFRVHQSNENSIFYYDESYSSIDINETISRIHEAGGLAFLAHGFIYPFKDKVKTIEEILSTTEIDGIECIYTLFSEEERKIAMDLCKKYNKYMSGGTDYHAKNKPDINLGTGKYNNVCIPKEIIEPWINKINII